MKTTSKIIVLEEWYTPEMCQKNPDAIFVFGDNMVGHGKGGQAIIRDEPNAFGIPTKVAPDNHWSSFMKDRIEEIDAVRVAILKLMELRDQGKTIIFPADGLGTGLAKMGEKSPVLYKWMNEVLYTQFGVEYGEMKS